MNSYGGYARTANNNQYVAPKPPARPKIRLRVSYNLQNSDQVQHRRHCFGINSLAINDDEGFLYSAGRDSTVRCWDVNKTPMPEHLSCFEHHTDWINDIFLCNNNKTMVSCSSDASIKIWDTETAQCSRTLNRHGDYVKALAYARQADMFASAGLDTNITLLDCIVHSLISIDYVVALTAPASPSLSCSSGFRNNVAPVVRTGVEKGSLYSLAMNATASVVLSGSTERLIRAWDPRSGQKIFKLKGHTDNIKSLFVNDEGTLCISGSSDFTLRLWDLRQQQCIHVFETHDDSVWSVAVDPTFTNVYSGGRDGSVFVTDLVTSSSTLICTEQNPVLKIAHSKRGGDSLWITTTDSCIKNWELNTGSQQRRVYSPPPTLSSSPTTSSFQGSKTAPIVSAPRATILGRPGMIKHHIMNNRRHVLTKDSSGVVELWDITQGKLLESFGVINYESKAEALTEIVSVPNWFSVDTKTGSLTVHLDFPQCFSAEVYAGDVFEDLPVGDEIQMNLGENVLRALFSCWEEGRRALDAKQKQDHRSHLLLPNGHSHDGEKRKSSDASNPKEDGSSSNHTLHDKSPVLSASNHLAPPSNSLSHSSNLTNPANPTLNSSSTLNNSTTLTNSTLNSGLGNSTTLKSSNGVTNPTSAEERQKFPLLNLPPSVSVIISEEGTGATMHRATRSQFVGDEPPEIIPPWVVDCLLHNDIPPSTMKALSVKLGFFLITADEKELPPLPQGNGRLSAFRLLRVKKVANYVVQKLELELPLVSLETKRDTPPALTTTTTEDKTDTETGGSEENEGSENGKNEERVLPEHYIDILCNNKLLLPHYSLATIKAFFWKSGEENIVLHYRINPKYANTTEGEKYKSTKKGEKGEKPGKDKQKTRNPFHRDRKQT